MSLRHLTFSLLAYTAAFAIAWSTTWLICELHQGNERLKTARHKTQGKSHPQHSLFSDP